MIKHIMKKRVFGKMPFLIICEKFVKKKDFLRYKENFNEI